MQSRFRSITVLKNRYGESDIEVGTTFYGKCGLWKELPKSDEIYDYEKYLTSDYMRDKEILPKETDTKENKPLQISITL